MYRRKNCEAIVSERLDLFTDGRMDVSEKGTKYIAVNPSSVLEGDGPVDFDVLSDGFLDLNGLQLEIKVKMIKADGTAMTANTTTVGGKVTGGDYPTPINHLFHMMWSQATLSLNEIETQPQTGNYGLMAYIHALLTTTAEQQKTVMSLEMFEKSTTFETTVPRPIPDPYDKTKAEYIRYREAVDGVTMIGTLNLDMLRQCKFLPPGTRIHLALIRQSPRVYYIAPFDGDYKLQILSCRLFIPKVSITEVHREAVVKRLQLEPARFPVVREQMIVRNIGKGETTLSLTDVTKNILPSRLGFVLIPSKAYGGTHDSNLLQFNSNMISYAQLFANDDPVGPPIVSNRHAYRKLFEDGPVSITLAEFDKGYAIYVWKLTTTDEPMLRRGTMRLELIFTAALPDNYKLCLFFNYPDLFKLEEAST
jgi:hypothetical protein